MFFFRTEWKVISNNYYRKQCFLFTMLFFLLYILEKKLDPPPSLPLSSGQCILKLSFIACILSTVLSVCLLFTCRGKMFSNVNLNSLHRRIMLTVSTGGERKKSIFSNSYRVSWEYILKGIVQIFGKKGSTFIEKKYHVYLSSGF